MSGSRIVSREWKLRVETVAYEMERNILRFSTKLNIFLVCNLLWQK